MSNTTKINTPVTEVDRPHPRVACNANREDLPRFSSAGKARIGEFFGSYELIRILGEGGMGEVYLAEQHEPIKRIVALKLIRTKVASDYEVHRFEAERQALARMNHPSIARVLEAGDNKDGQPFIVMEYVEGQPIIEFCENNRLSVEERLDLFTKVCDGIHHAHQKGILHRDIKPSNILITRVNEKPVVKIIDFGIAKALDGPLTNSEERTRDGVISGTPSYLSPESFERTPERHDIDIRSDVYALGVLLCELLTGATPFGGNGANLVQTMLEVTQGEVLAPSVLFSALNSEIKEERAELRRLSTLALTLRLRGDLDWIALKAMARDREARYGSAAEVALDVIRHLEDRPVTAGPPSRIYRAGKFLRRHRAGMMVTLLIGVALTAGLTARTREAMRANREAELAREAHVEAEEVVTFLVELFKVNDPGHSLGKDLSAHEILDRGRERISTELVDQPKVRARLLDVIGSVYREMGEYDHAASLLEEAIAIEGQEPLDAARRQYSLASVYWQDGRYDLSDQLYEKALATREHILGPDDPLVAASLDGLASSYRLRSRIDDAELLYQRAIVIREEYFGPNDEHVAESVHNLAVLCYDNGRKEEAKPLFERALDIRERVLGEDHPEVAHSVNGLAMVFSSQGDHERAELNFRRALAIRTKVLGPNHPDLAQSLNNLAAELTGQNKRSEARDLMQSAISIYETSLGPDHYRVGIGVHNLADLYRETGDYQAAEAFYLRALMIFETALGEEHLNVSYPLKGLADTYSELSRFEDSDTFYQQALEIRIKHLGGEHEMVTETREAHGAMLERSRNAELYLN